MDPETGRDYFDVLDLYRWYWLALVFLIVLIFAVRRLERSRVGRAWMAIREDEDAAAIMGVPTFKFKLWAFAIGAALGGISGALFASRQGVHRPRHLRPAALDPVRRHGGHRRRRQHAGRILGAILLTYLPERFRAIDEWRHVAFGVALVVMMILRPQGLWPSRRRAAELKDRQEEALEVAADV